MIKQLVERTGTLKLIRDNSIRESILTDKKLDRKYGLN